MGKRNKVVQLVILAAIALLGVIAISHVYRKPLYPKEGNLMPDLTLRTLQGDVVKLGDYQGKSLILSFWGSWCDPCAREMPKLQQAADNWEERNVEVLGVNIGEDALVVENYRKNFNFHFTMLLDAKQEAFETFGIQSLPTTFFVKPNGTIHAIHKGVVTTSQLESYLRQMARK